MRPENVSYPPKIINTKHYNGDSLYIQNNNISNDEKTKENRNILKSFRRPPKGIFLNLDELHSLTQVNEAETFDRLNNKIISLKQQIQSNKQDISMLMSQFVDFDKLISTNVFDLQKQVNNINNNQTASVTTIWTQREAELAIQGFNKYGKDFNAISQIIGKFICFYLKSKFLDLTIRLQRVNQVSLLKHFMNTINNTPI
jgi:hypothetical protein